MGSKTTKRQFEIFKKECDKWVGRFGLTGWEIVYKHEHITGDECSLGQNAWHCDGRWSVITLEKDWESELNDEKVKRVAFHEACELLFARTRKLACSRNMDEDELDEEMHNVIRILENVLWKKEKQ